MAETTNPEPPKRDTSVSDAAITALTNQVAGLQRELAEARAEAKDRRLKAKEITAERDRLRDELKASNTERDHFKGKAEAGPAEKDKRISELEADIRSRDHRDAWREAIGNDLAGTASVEEVWAKIGHKPGDKLPTAEEIAAFAKDARAKAPHLFKSPSDEGKGKPSDDGMGKLRLGSTPPPSSQGRGSADDVAGKLVIRSADYSNPRYLRENAKAIADARAAGTLVFAD